MHEMTTASRVHAPVMQMLRVLTAPHTRSPAVSSICGFSGFCAPPEGQSFAPPPLQSMFLRQAPQGPRVTADPVHLYLLWPHSCSGHICSSTCAKGYRRPGWPCVSLSAHGCCPASPTAWGLSRPPPQSLEPQGRGLFRVTASEHSNVRMLMIQLLLLLRVSCCMFVSLSGCSSAAHGCQPL